MSRPGPAFEKQQKMKAGQLAHRAGMGVQTLHYYERIGMLPKPQHSSGN